MPQDPVCGMTVDPKEAAGSSEHGGRLYFFCSPGCKKAFEKDPLRFIRLREQKGEKGGEVIQKNSSALADWQETSDRLDSFEMLFRSRR